MVWSQSPRSSIAPENSLVIIHLLLSAFGQFLEDVSREGFVDLTVSRWRLPNTRNSVLIPVVFRAVPHQNATESRDFPNQIDALHEITNSSTLRMNGSSRLVISRYRSRKCSLRSSRVSPCVQ